MNNHKRLAKLLTLCELLVQEIDHPTNALTPEAKEIKKAAEVLQEKLLPIVDAYYTQESVRRSNFSQTMQRKFDYIFDKEYKL